jgi:hypothetical protein
MAVGGALKLDQVFMLVQQKADTGADVVSEKPGGALCSFRAEPFGCSGIAVLVNALVCGFLQFLCCYLICVL